MSFSNLKNRKASLAIFSYFSVLNSNRENQNCRDGSKTSAKTKNYRYDDHVQPIVTKGSMLFCHNHENDRPSSRLRNSIHQTWNSPITDRSILHLFAHHCQTAAPQWHDQGTFGTEGPQPVDDNSRYKSTPHEPHSPPFRTHETIEWHASDSS